MATQTGSIDLTATNGVKLFADAGFKTAEETYATKSELELTNDAVALRATKTEARQMAQPNLSPFFSSHNTDGTYPDGNADGYWQPSANKLYNRSCFTALDDGWAHLEACDSVQKEFVPPRVDSLSAGDKVTMLVEYRNATNTGSGANFYTRNYSSNVQLTNNWSFITTQTGDGEERHVFTVSSADGQQAWNGLANVTFTSRASSTWTGDIRISFYLGEYTGPYKPYSGNVLYATQSELKVTADGISTEVSKKVNGTEIISAINQSAELIQIQASKVAITGDVVFSAINSDTGTTKISGGKIDATSITIGGSNLATQADVDSIEVGGRNLLAISDASLPKSTKSIAVESVGDGWLHVYGTVTGTSASGFNVFGVSGDAEWMTVNDTYTLTVENDGLQMSSSTIRVQFRYSHDGSLAAKYLSDSGSVTQEINGFISRVGFYIAAGATGTVLDGRVRLTLVKGNKSTDWTPAPEDTDASIAAVQDNLNATRAWYAECPTAAGTSAKVATITPTTTDFALAVGTVVAVKFEYANSVAAPTLNVNGTGAKDIKRYGSTAPSTSAASSWNAGSVVTLTYDGTDWQINNWLNNNDNYFDREQYKVPLAASAAISAGRVGVVGTDGKLKTLAASAFDYTKPILYVGTAYSAANVTDVTTRTSNYTFWGTAFTLTNTHSVTGAAAGKAVYIVGTVSGTTFTPNSTVLTCTTPTSANGLVYLRLGIMTSATAAVLESQHPMYMFHDGSFQQCDPATVASAKTATNYISADSTGIKIANANPATATTYQHLTATSTDFVVGGDSVLELDGTTGLRIGKASENYINVDNDSIDLMDGTTKMGSFKFTDRGANANYDIDRTVTFGLRNEIGAVEVSERKSSLSDGWYDVTTSLASYATYYGESGSTGGAKLGAISVDARYKNDGSDSVSIFSVQADRTVVDSGTQITLYSNDIEVRDPYGSEHDTVRLFHPTSLYSTGSVSVANQSWVSVANLTIPSKGTWMVVVTGDFASNATGRRVVGCTRNAAPSSTPAYDSQNSLIMAPANGAATKFNSSAIIDFDANDVYYAGVWQNSGGALTTRIMIKAVRLI